MLLCTWLIIYAGQMSARFPLYTNGRHDWADLTKEELLCWFGVLTLMELKDLPNIRLFRFGNDFYGCPLIKCCMTRQRFEAITKCVHLVDNSTLPPCSHLKHERLGKARWLVEHSSSISKEQYNCEVTLTVDEIMVPYKGRYCNIMQYMKGKSIRFGVKVWTLVSSKSHYISNLIVYQGAGNA